MKGIPQNKTTIFLKKGGISNYGKGKSSFSQDVANSVQAVLKEKGDYAIKELKANLYKDKSVATGNLVQSINPLGIKTENGKKIYVFEISKYYQWVDKGRGPRKSSIPGNPPLKEALVQWMNAKGIFPVNERKSIAYVIARKINRHGTKGNKFFSSVIDQEFVETLSREVSAAVRQAIEFNILEK